MQHPSQDVVKDRCWRTALLLTFLFLFEVFLRNCGMEQCALFSQRSENMKQTLAVRDALKHWYLTPRCQGIQTQFQSSCSHPWKKKDSSVSSSFLFIPWHGMQAHKRHSRAHTHTRTKKKCSEDLWLLVHTLRAPLTSFSPQEPCAENVGGHVSGPHPLGFGPVPPDRLAGLLLLHLEGDPLHGEGECSPTSGHAACRVHRRLNAIIS